VDYLQVGAASSLTFPSFSAFLLWYDNLVLPWEAFLVAAACLAAKDSGMGSHDTGTNEQVVTSLFLLKVPCLTFLQHSFRHQPRWTPPRRAQHLRLLPHTEPFAPFVRPVAFIFRSRSLARHSMFSVACDYLLLHRSFFFDVSSLLSSSVWYGRSRPFSYCSARETRPFYFLVEFLYSLRPHSPPLRLRAFHRALGHRVVVFLRSAGPCLSLLSSLIFSEVMDYALSSFAFLCDL